MLLNKDTILSFPDYSGKSEFVLHTDASKTAIGGVLSQRTKGETRERIITCFSRSLKGAELRWDTREKELFAVMFGLERCFEFTRGLHCHIFSDHLNLKYLLRLNKQENTHINQCVVVFLL